jgi:hypothetical protein
MPVTIKPSNTTFTLVIPRILKEKAETHAEKMGEPLALVMRKALREYLEVRTEKQTEMV